MNKSTHFPLQPFNLAYDFTDDINKDPDFSVSSGTYPRKAVPAVPLCEKWLLSIEESAAYFGVGQNRLAKLASQDGCKFVVFVGNTKRIKRKKFEEFLDEQYAI